MPDRRGIESRAPALDLSIIDELPPGRTPVTTVAIADSRREQVVERAVEDLVDAPADEHNNPVLLPNDNIACYDSKATNLHEIMRSIYEFILPIKLL